MTVIDELQDIQTKTLERLLKFKGLDDAALHKKANVQFLDCSITGVLCPLRLP